MSVYECSKTRLKIIFFFSVLGTKKEEKEERRQAQEKTQETQE